MGLTPTSKRLQEWIGVGRACDPAAAAAQAGHRLSCGGTKRADLNARTPWLRRPHLPLPCASAPPSAVCTEYPKCTPSTESAIATPTTVTDPAAIAYFGGSTKTWPADVYKARAHSGSQSSTSPCCLRCLAPVVMHCRAVRLTHGRCTDPVRRSATSPAAAASGSTSLASPPHPGASASTRRPSEGAGCIVCCVGAIPISGAQRHSRHTDALPPSLRMHRAHASLDDRALLALVQCGCLPDQPGLACCESQWHSPER